MYVLAHASTFVESGLLTKGWSTCYGSHNRPWWWTRRRVVCLHAAKPPPAHIRPTGS